MVDISKNTSIQILENEIWIDCFGFDGIYEVSNLGRVKSVGRFARNRNGEYWVKEKILKQNSKSLCVTLTIECNRFPFTVQRLVYESFTKDFIDESKNEVIERINKVKNDNRLENLRKVTKEQMVNNKTKKGCMKFTRINFVTKKNAILKKNIIVSKNCKVCNLHLKITDFYYGVNICKKCKNKINRDNYGNNR
jgi:hypothetical protein